MESERVEAAMAAQNEAGLVLRHQSRGDGSVRGTKGTQGHNEPTTPGWSLSNGAALPPQPTPDTSTATPESSWLRWPGDSPDGMGWIRIPAGTHWGQPGQGRCSTSHP